MLTIVSTGYPVSVSGMITLPVNSSMYQTMVANIQQLQSNQDGTLCITPMQVHKSACSSHHHHHSHPNGNQTPAHQQHTNSTGPPIGSCGTSHCGTGNSSGAVSSATTATTTTTCTPAHSTPSFPLYNPYVAHQHHHAHLFGQSTAAAAAAQLRSAAAMGLAAAAAASGSSAATAAAAAAAQHLKLNRAMLRNLSPAGVGPMVAAAGDGGEALLRSLEKHLSGHGSTGGGGHVGGHKTHSSHSNAHTVQENNLNNNCENAPNAMVPKLEMADDGQAVIDSDGNIIIRFGNSAPIKIECDSTDFKV